MMRERMSRPSSSVPNQCACDGESRRAGRLMAAGSCGAIHGANRAKITKTITNTTPVAASGLWRTFPAAQRRNEMAVVDIESVCAILGAAAPCLQTVRMFQLEHFTLQKSFGESC